MLETHLNVWSLTLNERAMSQYTSDTNKDNDELKQSIIEGAWERIDSCPVCGCNSHLRLAKSLGEEERTTVEGCTFCDRVVKAVLLG